MSNINMLSRPNIDQTVSIKAVNDMRVRFIIYNKASIKVIVNYINHDSSHVSIRVSKL